MTIVHIGGKGPPELRPPAGDKVSQRYKLRNRLLRILNWVPQWIRQRAAALACWRPGLYIVEIGSGWGTNAPSLSVRAGQWGRVDGVEREERSFAFAKWKYRHLANVRFINVDVFEFEIPELVDCFYFSFSYCTIPDQLQRMALLRKLWEHLPRGGRIVFLEAGIKPDSPWRYTLPVWRWLLMWTLMSNPYIDPRDELAQAVGAENVARKKIFFAYHVTWAEKA